jgi:hypothetical protein
MNKGCEKSQPFFYARPFRGAWGLPRHYLLALRQ